MQGAERSIGHGDKETGRLGIADWFSGAGWPQNERRPSAFRARPSAAVSVGAGKARCKVGDIREVFWMWPAGLRVRKNSLDRKRPG
jgi:hypothetical protein